MWILTTLFYTWIALSVIFFSLLIFNWEHSSIVLKDMVSKDKTEEEAEKAYQKLLNWLPLICFTIGPISVILYLFGFKAGDE